MSDISSSVHRLGSRPVTYVFHFSLFAYIYEEFIISGVKKKIKIFHLTTRRENGLTHHREANNKEKPGGREKKKDEDHIFKKG